jgi:hypothetical protein
MEARELLEQLKTIILDFVVSNEQGVTNSEIAKELGLESSFDGKSRNYLTYSILGELYNEKKITKIYKNNKVLYFKID